MTVRKAFLLLVGLLVGAMAVASLAACTHSGGRPKPARPALSRAWATSGIAPVTGVTVIGKVTVFYGTEHDQLYLYGMATASGHQLWRQLASTSDLAEGTPIYLSQPGGKLAYFRPVPDPSGVLARIVIADPATGKDIAVSAERAWLTTPDTCGALLCASARGFGASLFASGDAYRIDPLTGVTSIDTSAPPGYRDLGSDLVDLLQRNPEQIAKRTDGKTVWSHPLSTIFGDGVSTDNGWDFEQFGDVIVGTVSRPATQLPGQSTYHSAPGNEMVTAGFSAKTGALIWRQAGESVMCNNSLSVHASGGAPLPLRCRYSGSFDITYPPDGSTSAPTVANDGLDVAVERFDPATGTTIWSTPVGQAPTLAGIGPHAAATLLSDSQALVTSSTGKLVLNLATGSTRAPATTDVFWCGRELKFLEAPRDPANRPNVRYANGLAQPCESSGTSTTRLPAAVPTNVSTRAGALSLVSTPTAVVAYRRN